MRAPWWSVLCFSLVVTGVLSACDHAVVDEDAQPELTDVGEAGAQSDALTATPSCDANAHTGDYCGGDKVSHANANTLYRCHGPGPAVVEQTCAYGCFVAPAGQDDSCRAAPRGPVCGNGIVEGDETCDEDDPDCVDCQIPCAHEGGRSCGQNGIPGDSGTLYECRSGHRVPIADCEDGCLALPPGTPDRCATSSSSTNAPAQPPASPSTGTAIATSSIPAGLLRALRATPYVEERCTATRAAGWPYEAKRCRYTSGPMTTNVVVADPTAERVARWIMDSVKMMPLIAALQTSSPARYEEAVVLIANDVMGQSSRIFPISGGIIENMGNGYVNYPFDRGVAVGCHGGCYCRINSLHRTEWCAYQAGIGAQSYDACIAHVGATGLTNQWGNECLNNEIRAWTSDRNEHFRARAFRYQKEIRNRCPRNGSCTPAQLVAALRGAL